MMRGVKKYAMRGAIKTRVKRPAAVVAAKQ